MYNLHQFTIEFITESLRLWGTKPNDHGNTDTIPTVGKSKKVSWYHQKKGTSHRVIAVPKTWKSAK